MNNQQKFVLAALALTALIVYLFVSAPAKLPDQPEAVQASESLIPIEAILKLIARENDVARSLYTAEIVGPGQQVGLVFNEDWLEQSVEAGPLPALFLRETSAGIERSPIAIGLFLGSEYPIALSNRFSGPQLVKFAAIKETREPVFFFDSDTEVYTAMFPDFAAVQPCVDCHNGHPDSPKKDWALNDVMGATTWTYPKEAVTVDESLRILKAVRNGIYEAYGAYIEKAAGFSISPEIGEQWPRDGYFLPSPEVFRAEFESRAAPLSLQAIMDAVAQGSTVP